MAKLPDINYLTSTASLGRENIALPGAVARAQSGLIQAVGQGVSSVVEAEMDRQVSSSVAGAQSELSDLKLQLMEARIIDVDRWGLSEGADYPRADVDGNPLEKVSSWQVMEKLWTDKSRAILSKYTTGMSSGQQRAVGGKLGGSIQKMGGVITQQALKWRDDEYTAQAEQEVHTLTTSAAFETKDDVKMQVSAVYNGMIRSGIMGAEEGTKKIRTARAKVDYHVSSRLIVNGGQTELDQVEDLLAARAEDGGLELMLEQRKALYTQLDARQGRIETNREKSETEARKQSAVGVLIDIRDEGPKPWNDIRALVRDMEPSDARLIATLNDAKLTELEKAGETSDPVIAAQLEANLLLAELAPYSGDVTPNTMNDALTNQIVSHVTDFRDGKPGLDANTASTMAQRVKSMTQKRMSPPGMREAMGQLSLYINKMPESAIGMSNNGPAAAKWAEAKADLINGIRDGVIRDPWAWVEANHENYLSGTAVANMAKADIAVAEQFKVSSDPGGAAAAARIPVNVSATLAKAEQAYREGRINKKTYQMTVDYWRDRRASYIANIPMTEQ